jgi:TolB protein
VLSAVLVTATAHAELTIRITQGVEAAVPVAIVPFVWEGVGEAPAERVDDIVAADLERSGRFRALADSDLPELPLNATSVRYPLWRATGADAMVLGTVQRSAEGNLDANAQLLDVFQGSMLEQYGFSAPAGNIRRLAHVLSDRIYARLTGEKGAFDTRIAYVTEVTTAEGPRYSVVVADADGHAPQNILRSPEPLMSPSWASDGRRLAYVSFETGRPQIFVQEVYTGNREAVSFSEGINGAPAWSPDGRLLALVLSRDGNPEIYTLELANRQLTRLTNDAAIDTEPAWTPDGKSILFTSDRGGGAQIYRMSASGGSAERLTFEGSYNARPNLSPDGRQVAIVHRRAEGFRIAVLDLETRLLRVLTDGPQDESPSFAPNGAMILYAVSATGGGEMRAVSVDGRVKQQLQLQGGNVREPAWGPYNR